MPLLTAIRAFVLVVVAAVVACAGGAHAQAPPAATANAVASPVSPALPPALPTTETIRKNVDEVNVVFTVTNAGGRFVSRLSLDDLEVLDNQRPPERISYFRQQSEMPLRVALLVDLSDSIVHRFNYEKKAAAAFLKKVLRPEVDQAFLVGFGSEVKLLQDFTSDIGTLSQAMRGMKAGGNTKLYDAILFASAKLQRESDTSAVRRAIVIISDGVDTFSHGLFYDATKATLRTQATIYALSTNDVRQEGYTKGEAVLDLLAQPSGGAVLPANTERQMARAFEKVKEALHSQYVVGYKPADFQPDGTFRTIKIVPRNRKMVVNCRRGYFAPREEHDSASHALAP